MLITFGLHFNEKCTKKCIPYLSGQFSKLQPKKSHGFKPYPYPNIFIPLANWTKFNAKKGGGSNYLPSTFQSGESNNCPQLLLP